MRSLLLAILALSLAGCWSGESFYATSEGVAAIPAGKYETVFVRDYSKAFDDSDLGRRVRIKYTPDGHAIIENTDEGGDSSNSLLVKLGETPGLYVVQAELGASIPKVGSALYALVRTTPDGYQISIPKCDQQRLKAWSRVVVSGLTVGKPVCVFNTRSDLEAALLDYDKAPINWTEYRRVEKRSKR